MTAPDACAAVDGPLTERARSTRAHPIERRMVAARVLWSLVVAVALGLFAFGVPARFDELRQQYGGQIGLDVSRNVAGQIVLSPWWNGAAALAGILEGDILVAVNGTPVGREGQAPAQVVIPAGDAGSRVTLSVRTGGFPVRRYSIVRAGDDGLALARLGLSPDVIAAFDVAIDIVCTLFFFAIAAVLIWRRADDWLATLVALMLLITFVGVTAPVIALYRAHVEWQPALDLWFALGLALLCVSFYLFPDGWPVPRGTLVLAGALALWTLAEPIFPELYPWKLAPLSFFFIILGWLGTGLAAQLYRYRFRADAIRRQQTKWIVFGAGAASLGLLAIVWRLAWPAQSGTTDVLYDLAIYPASRLLVALLPLSIGIAILRYRLWDIDLLINRTLVYGSLTVGVVGLYALMVGGSGALLQARGNLVISLLATGVIAVLFHPMRERLQSAVNHLMYGERDEPYTVLSRLSRRLGAAIAPETLLQTVVETVGEALKLPYAAIAVDRGDSLTLEAAYGTPVADPLILPLTHQAESVGQLILAPRAPGEVFSPADRRLLDDLAGETGAAVHAMLLTLDLQRSRERLVTAQEEERRRLRRDLHDGLGPALASVILKLGAARRLLEPDSEAHGLLADIRSDVQGAVGDIRRLVHALRPPVLDELGLVQAIRHQAAQYGPGEPAVIVEAPEQLPALPAAVEVTAYRIALEALTNVVRHAQASTCHLRLAIESAPGRCVLALEVVDDGRGLPSGPRNGVGIRSMQERVAELGGTLVVQPDSPTGTIVRARIPLSEGSQR